MTKETEDRWTEVEGAPGLDAILELFGGFHDSLVKEAHVVNTGWVGESDLALHYGAFSVRVLFQRQFREPSALEVVFDGVRSVSFGHPGEISEGTVSKRTIDGSELFVLTLDETEVVFERLWYRDASEWMGKDLRLANDK